MSPIYYDFYKINLNSGNFFAKLKIYRSGRYIFIKYENKSDNLQFREFIIAMKKKVILGFILFISSHSYAQQEKLTDFNQKRLLINQRGMTVLAGWALLNLAVGGSRLFDTEGVDKNFHIMNATWGAVNMAIAGFGYFSSLQDPAGFGLYDTFNEQKFIQQFLLFNAGLDVAYIVGGFYLKERSERFSGGANRTKYERFKGFGRSLILQGSFLLAFDLTLFFMHKLHGDNNLPALLKNLEIGWNQVGIRLWL